MPQTDAERVHDIVIHEDEPVAAPVEAGEVPSLLEQAVIANPSPGFSYTRREIQIRIDERQKCVPSAELLEAVRVVVAEFRKYTNNESDWGDVMAEVSALDRLMEVK